MDVYRPGPSNCLDTPRMNQLCEHQDGILTNGSFHLPDGGFPGGSAGKESTCNAGDLGLIAGLGRSSGEGKGYPLQYSGLESSMDCIAHGVTKSWTRLSNFHFQPWQMYRQLIKNPPKKWQMKDTMNRGSTKTEQQACHLAPGTSLLSAPVAVTGGSLVESLKRQKLSIFSR